MTNVLVVKANNRPDGISTMMYNTFVEEASKNDSLNITTFDVFAEAFPHYGQDLFNAFGKLKNGEALNEKEAASIAAQRKSQEAVKNADVIVFAFPLWNLTIPSALHSFLDYTIQAGFTFKYNAEGKKEFLLGEKKVYLLNARGGFYSRPEMNALEMAVNYMHVILNNYVGLAVTDEVIIEGHSQDPANAQTIIADGLEKVKALAATL